MCCIDTGAARRGIRQSRADQGDIETKHLGNALRNWSVRDRTRRKRETTRFSSAGER